jgi:hypothetical protein
MVVEDENTASAPLDAFVDDIDEQAAEQSLFHGHISRLIEHLDIDADCFGDFTIPNQADDTINAVIRMFLYQHAHAIGQSELARRLKGAGFVYRRCGLSGPVSQPAISHNWLHRLSLAERQAIEAAGECIYQRCVENEVTVRNEPAPEPEYLTPEKGVDAKQIIEKVEEAMDLGLGEFSADRASNKKYALEAFFERQGYTSVSEAGTTTPRRKFGYHSRRDEVPHGSTHMRTMKKVTTPAPQTTLSEFETGKTPHWKRIRDEVLGPFHTGVEKQLDEIAGRARTGIRNPVEAAADITTINYWPSPFRREEDVDWDEEPVVLPRKNGPDREVYPKPEFPEMVSGFKDPKKKRHERGYKFATLTIIVDKLPIIVAIEPVRDERRWEKHDPSVDVERTSRADIIRRLLTQAEQHVEIHKLFCDKEFDAHEVRDVIDRRTIQYVTGKRTQSAADYEHIEEIIEDPVYDARIEHAWGTFDGREHKVSIVYLPGGDYSQFILNGWVDADRADALTTRYRKRWVIENQYKRLKADFLPSVGSKDYRLRFLYFVIGVIMHNIWRVGDFLLRDEADVELGEKPVFQASEVPEIFENCLFEPD